MYTQENDLAGDMVPSLTRSKKHGSELKIFCLDFSKTRSNQYIKFRTASKTVRFFKTEIDTGAECISRNIFLVIY